MRDDKWSLRTSRCKDSNIEGWGDAGRPGREDRGGLQPHASMCWMKEVSRLISKELPVWKTNIHEQKEGCQ